MPQQFSHSMEEALQRAQAEAEGGGEKPGKKGAK